jgi:DNA-binding NarL/FixJ family response regulator
MTKPSAIRVCIIDDHAIVRAGVRTLLNAQPDIEVIGEAVDRNGALELAAKSPDIFLVDLQLGKDSAVDFLDELLNITDARAIVLTGGYSEDQIHRAIQAGATGLVYKEDDPEVLIRAIRKVYAGEAWLTRSMMTSALSRLRSARTSKNVEASESVKIATLTTREREIVALVARGINRKRIAESLFVSEATVRNHLTSIFGKLGLSNQFELVFYAQRHGLDKPSDSAALSASSS